MKYTTAFLVLSILVVANVAIAGVHSSANHTSYVMTPSSGDKIGPSGPARECFLFQLQGVIQADPNVGGTWFGVLATHPSYKYIVMMLLMAYGLDIQVHVVTTGDAVCGGVAEVNLVHFD